MGPVGQASCLPAAWQAGCLPHGPFRDRIMTKHRLSLFAGLALCVTAAPLAAQQAPSYAKQIQPFFARYCLECHSGQEPEGGLNLESYKSLLRGGEHGSALTPGKPDASRIVRLVEGKAKP